MIPYTRASRTPTIHAEPNWASGGKGYDGPETVNMRYVPRAAVPLTVAVGAGLPAEEWQGPRPGKATKLHRAVKVAEPVKVPATHPDVIGPTIVDWQSDGPIERPRLVRFEIAPRTDTDTVRLILQEMLPCPGAAIVLADVFPTHERRRRVLRLVGNGEWPEFTLQVRPMIGTHGVKRVLVRREVA